MIVTGTLGENREVTLRFYGHEDVRADEFTNQPQPTSWVELRLPADSARAILAWLNTDRSIDLQHGSVCGRGSGDWVLLENNLSGIMIRMSTPEEIGRLVQELSDALSLILGHPIEPHE
jgi:hypothetical protein